MKKSTKQLMILFLIGIFSVYNSYAANIWVAPNGSDSNDGSESAPLATIQQALSNARVLRQMNDASIEGGIHIILKGGTYQLTETVLLTQADAGTPTSPTYIEAALGEVPVLSGGVTIANWQEAGNVDGLPDIAQNRVWVANIPALDDGNLNFRQLWVNGFKMKRASTFDDNSLTRIISVDKENGQLTIPTPKVPMDNFEGMEMTIIQDWLINILRINSVVTSGNRTTLTFKSPESEIEFKRPWPILRADEGSHSNHFFYLSNGMQFLNRPQEWYLDSIAGKIYYWPRAGENLTTFKATAPQLESLLQIEGNLDNIVSNIHFKGISFQHTSWMRPSHNGHVPLQAGNFIYDAYSDESAPGGNVAWVGRQAAAVSLVNAQNVYFTDCTFANMAATALDFESGTKNVGVEGSVFNDIGGTAIQVGYYGDENFESHLPYNPTDDRVVCDGVTIRNNYITNPCTEDWGCLGIATGFASGVIIDHNEIQNAPYSAISMGWGWTVESNCMANNHITANYINGFSSQMRDGGAIYTLSSQPNSSVVGNRIEGVGDPLFNPLMWNMKHAQFDIYLDEGSDYFTVKDNWCQRNAISRNKNGGNNTWGTNGPTVSETIKNAAGLQPEYAKIKQQVKQQTYPPLDTIAEMLATNDIVEFIADGEGFKLGSAMAVDLTSNGLLDIVYSGGESFQVQQGGVRLNNGDFNFVATQPLQRVFMSNFAAGDLNGDGYIDLIQAGWDFWSPYNAVLLNDGKGNLTETVIEPPLNTAPACGIADLNNNGLPDYFFIGNGSDNSFYMQKHDRTFNNAESKLALPGGFSDPNVIYADFDNDGDIDICLLSNKTGGVYTRMWVNKGDGTFEEKEIGVTEKGTRGTLAYADVNGDGYLDILVGGVLPNEDALSGGDGTKTYTLYLNNKEGGFVKHQEFSEYFEDNTTQSAKFGDWNNNGSFDLIVTGWNLTQGNESRTSLYLNDGQGNFTLSDVELPGVSEGAVELADFNNNGKLDVLITGNCNSGFMDYIDDRRIAVLCKNNSLVSNTPPSPPSNLMATVDGDNVVLSWNAGSDNESDVSVLSYNYYLVNEETGSYLTFPNADIQTGNRMVSEMGNAWMNLSWPLKNLPGGTYKWSVQTIDAGYAGSEFASEQSFTIEGVPSITFSHDYLTFDELEGNTQVSLDILGLSLTDDISIVVPDGFSVSQTTIAKEQDGSASATINVTFNGNEEVRNYIEFKSGDFSERIRVIGYLTSNYYTPFYPSGNLIVDPYLSAKDPNFSGWGHGKITTDTLLIYGGSRSYHADGTETCWPNGATLDYTLPVSFEPNTYYLLRAMIKTMDGTFAFEIKGADIEGENLVAINMDTYGEWKQFDTIFVSGNNPSSDNNIFFNNCGGSTGTQAFLDNYELYKIPFYVPTKELVFTEPGEAELSVFAQMEASNEDIVITAPKGITLSKSTIASDAGETTITVSYTGGEIDDYIYLKSGAIMDSVRVKGETLTHLNRSNATISQSVYVANEQIHVLFQLKKSTQMNFSIYNLAGKLVANQTGTYNAGKHTTVIKEKLKGGIYLIKVDSGGDFSSYKVVK